MYELEKVENAFEKGINSCAIEGLELSEEEKQYMIALLESGMTADEIAEQIKKDMGLA